jgi:hemoglobin
LIPTQPTNSEPTQQPTTHFEAIGGEEGVRKLVDRFYDLMDASPEAAAIRALHPEDLAGSREKLFMFFVGWMGGPPLYETQVGPPRLRARHIRFPIGVRERDEWMWCMRRALKETQVPEPFSQTLEQAFAKLADFMRNRDTGEG